MKRVSIIILSLFLAAQFTGCVTKQKYTELQNQYKRCQDDLTYTNSENVDFANAKKQLTADLNAQLLKVEQLEKDTLALSRRLRQSERDLAKATRDYDELLKNFAEQNVNNQSQMNQLLDNIDKIKDDLAAQQDSLNAARAVLEAKEARIREMQNILDQKDAEVKALKDKVSAALKGFEGSGLNVMEKDGKVYVSMEDKLLFASGSWTINEQGLNAIRQLASVLESEKEISVLIEGHTDNVPYRGSGQVKDNWDLSVLRATSVVKAILASGNIAPVRLSASGRSEYLPIDTNDSAEARAKNRRTEIILTPNLDKLFELIQNN